MPTRKEGKHNSIISPLERKSGEAGKTLGGERKNFLQHPKRLFEIPETKKVAVQK